MWSIPERSWNISEGRPEMKIKGYHFQSCFGPYLEEFIQEKKDAGFIYESEEWRLKHFDAFCMEESVQEPVLTRDLALKWGALRAGEALSTGSARLSILRQFALFLTAIGIDAYVPSKFYKAEKTIAHILSDEEITALFTALDDYVPALNTAPFIRLADEYKVIFRLIYCCGLRISEARTLKWENVDLDEGKIRILQSKGHKDRLVYLAEDLKELLRSYGRMLETRYHCDSEWVFPAREPDKCLSNATLTSRFRQSWSKTSFAERCDKAPTVHSLRHSFVVKRMNTWMKEGVSLKEMMPFLSKYLGHTSPKDTFYYYHQVDKAFRIIRENDKTSTRVIPEVLPYD